MSNKLIDKLKAAQSGKGGQFLTLKPDGEFGMGVRIHFLQELDEDSPNFNEKFGLAKAVDVHEHPTDFKKQAACTFESEGKCWACEQAAGGGDTDWKWRARTNLLINVLVKKEDAEPVVRVLRKKMGKNDIGVQLLEYAEEYKSVTDRDYRYKRSGTSMNETKYTLTSLDECPIKYEGELINLDELVKVVAYADQSQFFGDPFDENNSTGWENQ